MMQRMLNTAEPTMVPTPTSPFVMNTPMDQRHRKPWSDSSCLVPASSVWRAGGHKCELIHELVPFEQHQLLPHTMSLFCHAQICWRFNVEEWENKVYFAVIQPALCLLTDDRREEFRSWTACCHEGCPSNILAQMKTLIESEQSSNKHLSPDVDVSSVEPTASSYLAYHFQWGDKIVIANQSQSVEHVDRLQGQTHNNTQLWTALIVGVWQCDRTDKLNSDTLGMCGHH